jgi:hypothetical protein
MFANNFIFIDEWEIIIIMWQYAKRQALTKIVVYNDQLLIMWDLF